MTNLTEKWIKDEIYKGTYYCKSKLDGHHCIAGFVSNKDLFDCDYNGTLNKGYWEVLAEVPSYEELQNQAFILKSRESEIVKLKELLKRCKRIIEIDEYVSITGAGRDILWDLLQDLKQVLGEE